jgi:protein-tyrosine phosphatase
LIDCHCHLLPGIDDGPKTLDESLAMARTLEELGFAEVHCTPHCIHGLYENSPTIVRERLAELQQVLQDEGFRLRLKPGMEYYLDSHFPVCLEDPQPLGTSRLLLVEAPTWAEAEMVLDNLRRVVERGYVPLLAHPERWSLLAAPGQGRGAGSLMARLLRGGKSSPSLQLLGELHRLGCLFQGNLGSFAGGYGKMVEKRAWAFLRAGLYSCLGSDSHPRFGLQEMIHRGLRRLSERSDQGTELLSAARLLS